MTRLTLVGVCVAGACTALAVGAERSATAEVSAQARPQLAAPRFQIVFSPHVRADTFLLDTETGRVWQQVQNTNLQGEPTFWDLQDRIDDPEAYRAWTARHKLK